MNPGSRATAVALRLKADASLPPSDSRWTFLLQQRSRRVPHSTDYKLMSHFHLTTKHICRVCECTGIQNIESIFFSSFAQCLRSCPRLITGLLSFRALLPINESPFQHLLLRKIQLMATPTGRPVVIYYCPFQRTTLCLTLSVLISEKRKKNNRIHHLRTSFFVRSQTSHMRNASN